MKKCKAPVRFTGQHFTVDEVLIADAIRIAGIKADDIVLDIGAGKGALTGPLARQCKTVIAIEKDRYLQQYLRKKFAPAANVSIAGVDFRDYTLPETGFKVVSSIPYAITSCILKSLMFDRVGHFTGGSLIMQLEAASKLCSGKSANPYTIFYHTFFELTLACEIAPASFLPPPKVRSALVRIRKKESAVRPGSKEAYLGLLTQILHRPGRPVGAALKRLFRKSQVRAIMAKSGIDPGKPVARLSASQWSACFLAMLDNVPEKYHPGG